MSTKENQYIQFCKYLHINRIHNESIELKVRTNGTDYTELSGERDKCNLCNEILEDWGIIEHFKNHHYEYCTYCPECGRGFENLSNSHEVNYQVITLSSCLNPDVYDYSMSIYHHVCKLCNKIYVNKTDNFLDYEYVVTYPLYLTS